MDKNQNGRPSIPPRRGIFDVVRPGRTPASPTSRPVVNNQKPVQDNSMMVGSPAVPRGLTDTSQPAAAPPQISAPAQPTPASVAKPQQSMTSRLTPQQTSVNQRPAMQYNPEPMQPQQEVGKGSVVGQIDAPENVPQHENHPPHAHRHSILSEVLAVVAIVFLIAVILNILVDADVLNLPIPHTNFFEY